MDGSDVLGLDLFIGWKLACAVVIAIVCFLGALIPTRLIAILKGRGNILSYANCLGAGILLGASFIHLLSDAEEDDPFPSYVPHMIAGIGLILSFALEKVLFGHGHSHAHLPGSDAHHHHHHDEDHKHHHNHDLEVPLTSENDTPILSDGIEMETIHLDLDLDEDDGPIGHEDIGGEGHGHKHEHEHSHGHEHEEEEEIVVESGSHGHSHGEEHGHSHGDGGAKKRFPYILFVILGLESVISGSALGVQTTKTNVIVLLFAIVTHIWAESFTLCVGVLKSGRTEKVTLLIMALYSLLTPIGIALGILTQVLTTGTASAIISAVLVSFAAGSFLYIATLEIITEEFESKDGRFIKLFLMCVGYTFMALLVIILPAA